jgi:phosphoadenosine phosphosulfate reductase
MTHRTLGADLRTRAHKLAPARQAKASPDYDEKLAQTRALLVQACTDYAPLKQASSLGAEDMVIMHLAAALGLRLPLFVLDTGLLHEQTLALLERTRASSGQRLEVFRPQPQAVQEFEAREGHEAMYRSLELRKTCCAVRKVEPLQRALVGQRAWITGLRREQSAVRSEVPLRDDREQPRTGRVQFNPLALWTWGDVWHYIATESVDYNSLHDHFFPSIGCAPCTRAVSLGEDLRAGRWWWEQPSSKECGLHSREESLS